MKKYPGPDRLGRFENATARVIAACRGDSCPIEAPAQPEAPEAPAAPATTFARSAERLRTPSLALVGAAALMLALLPGATCSSLPERDNCAPRTRRCVNNAPQVCSHEGRWHLSGDQACSPGTVCFIAPDGRAGCTRQPQDGGAP